MDTCLILAGMEIQIAEVCLEQMVKHLHSFGILEEENETYRANIEKKAQRWKMMTKEVSDGALHVEPTQPYERLRFVGSVELEEVRHGLQIFLYPVSQTEAKISIAFSKTVYEHLYNNKPDFEKDINVYVKRELISLAISNASHIKAKSFVILPTFEFTDLTPSLKVHDIQQWLTDPTDDLIDKYSFLFVGIKNELVDEKSAKKIWPSTQIYQSSADFMIYDAMT